MWEKNEEGERANRQPPEPDHHLKHSETMLSLGYRIGLPLGYQSDFRRPQAAVFAELYGATEKWLGD